MNVAPMIGIDATRSARCWARNYKYSPVSNILTNGDPREILHPFRFGDLPQSSYQETDSLSKHGSNGYRCAVDSAGIAGQINGEATAAGISYVARRDHQASQADVG
jgi:hypothetical protein